MRVGSKVDRVCGRLRASICSGKLAPSSRLPSWDEMVEQFQVGRPTLMRALEQLKQDGFIYSDSTRGTFVAAEPPHLFRYAIVFTSGPGEAGWNRYWQALSAEASGLTRLTRKQIKPFYHVSGHEDDESYARLRREVLGQQFAGVILAGEGRLASLPLWKERSLPTVFLGSWGEPAQGVRLEIDRSSFVRRSLEWMRQRGRKRIAVLADETQPYAEYAQQLARFGMVSKPQWRLTAHAAYPAGATNLVHLLLDRDTRTRPDGLIITDDNLVESALSGVVAAGVEVPRELEVVGHCNWPWPVGSVIPIQRLGFDTGAILRKAIHAIDELRDGRRVSRMQQVEATFEDEQAQAAAPVA